MLSSLLGAALRHVIILLSTYAAIKPIPFLNSWLPQSEPKPWKLDYEDVLKARAQLKALGLPMELALEILEYAEYWPARHFSSKEEKTVKVAATMFRSSTAGLCVDVDIFNDPAVDSLRKNGERVKIKAVEFQIRSRDQGWTSEPTQGTFSTSSWLETSILRGVEDYNTQLNPSCWLDSVFESPRSFQQHITPQGWQLVRRPEYAEQGPQGGEGDLAWYLQGNRVATQGHSEEYKVRWTNDSYEGNEGSGRGEGFLSELKEGDRLLVWARAKVRGISIEEEATSLSAADFRQWPGWQCVVENVSITVYYGLS